MTASQPRLRRLVLPLLAILLWSCQATEPSSPALSVAPTQAPTITQRPTVPAGLAVAGEDAPRNVADPCALLTIAEIDSLLGGPPQDATRSIEEGDAWVCHMLAGPGNESELLVTVSVNGATTGWMDDLDANAGTQIDPATASVPQAGAIITEFGPHLLVVAVADADGAVEDTSAALKVVRAVVARSAPS